MGRKQGSSDETQPFTIRLTGNLAQTQYPTFQPGTIAVRMGKNGNMAYGKVGATNFHANDDLASIFPGPPTGIEGLWESLDNLDSIKGYVETLDDKEKWDALAAVKVEVIHLDPRDRGGFVITCADLDLASMAPSVDIYVPAEQEDNVDFGVGSTLMLVGSPWVSREGEGRLAITGWWCIDAIQLLNDGGWDE